MKLAFDLRPLQIGHQNRGIGAYILNVLQGLPKDSSITYIFMRYDTSNPINDYDLGEGRNYVDVTVKKRTFSKHPLNLLVYGLTSMMPVFYKLKRHRPDVFVQCDYLLSAPRSWRCKVITISYDLIPFKLKEIYLPSWKKYIGYRQLRLRSRVRLVLHAWFYGRKYKNGLRLLRRSDTVISISENTTKTLLETAGLSAKKIATIYPAASFRHTKEDLVIRDEIKSLVDSMKVPYIAYVGGTDRRRQVEELIYAYNLYNSRNAPVGLLLGGNEFKMTSKSLNPLAKQALKASSYKDNLHLLGRISEAEKLYLLKRAAVFVYPTLYEGFGLPVVEAMSAGCPVITYNNSSMPEVAGNAAFYTDGYGSYPIYKALTKLLEDTVLADKLRKRGKTQAKKFDWEISVKAVWDEILKFTT